MCVVVVASCGRIGFDPGDGGARSDVAAIDALPSGLVVWFPLETAMPNDVVSGGVGTCVNPTCPTVTAGYRNAALMFDGIDDCIVIADYAALHQATPTIAIRARIAVVQDTAALAKRVDVVGGPYDTWELGAGPTNALELTTNHGGTSEQIATPDGDVMVGRWQHFAFTWDGATKRVYVDGAERASGPSTMPLSYDANNAYIGCDDNGGLVRFFSGALDEMQIYDRALSASEIASLAAM